MVDYSQLGAASFAELTALRSDLDARVYSVAPCERREVRRALALVTAVRAYRFPDWRASPVNRGETIRATIP